GGFSYVAQGRADSGWQVKENANDLTMSFTNRSGETEKIQINAKAGDDIEELATYINGQTDKVTASVNEKGQLQIFMAGEETAGTISFSGDLASELGMSLKGYDAVNNLNITTVGGAQQAVAVLDTAMKFVDSQRAELGAYQNRFNHAINNLDNIHENLAASNSRIQDTDYAKETTQMVKQQILQQVSTTILAQAKQAPNLALTLLG
ncbi:flagellin, partial [Vibrio parahaemolyticus]|nr:flagellin [Vibrio parahaemolyticus]